MMRLQSACFCTAFLLLMSTGLQGGIHYYVVDRNLDDGMEINDALWMPDGTPDDDHKIYMGRIREDYTDAGLRFHLEDQQQADRFALARLCLFAAEACIDSGLALIIRGVDQDSAAGFSQLNRPSALGPLTEAATAWNVPGPHVSMEPGYYYSPDISPITNEILQRSGWGSGEEGKTVAILIENEATPLMESNYAAFYDASAGAETTGYLELYDTVIDTFIGGPVLSKPKRDGISVSLISLLETDCYIEFGNAPGHYTHAIGASQTMLPEIDPILKLDAENSIELKITALNENTRYYYRLRAREFGSTGSYLEGPEYSFTTSCPAGEYFNFAFLTDSHVGHGWVTCPNCWLMGSKTIRNAMQRQPDFFIVGGDEACTDGAGFPFDGRSGAEANYYWTRHYYGPLANVAPVFLVLGNHEGEGSFHRQDIREASYAARKKYFYNPEQTTYPFGGGARDNYFAWEWGDALFICLDVFYNTGPINPKYIEPFGSGWHLGWNQLMWLRSVLSQSEARWKFIFAHHILAGWAFNGYGRGGAKYAHDFEQGVVHQLMRDYGAQIYFHGHDHVFADDAADGIHYTAGTQCFGIFQPSWTLPDSQEYPYFVDAYPDGYQLGKGYVHVRVGPRSVWVDFIASALDSHNNNRVIYSYQLADVLVHLIPPPELDIPIELLSLDSGQSPGQQPVFRAVFSNETDTTQSFDYWLRIKTPVVQECVYVFENNSLPPGDSLTVEHGIRTCGILFPGPYAVSVEVGAYPDDVISSDTFSGEILP